VTITASAATGARTVTVNTSSCNSAALASAFTVSAPPPSGDYALGLSGTIFTATAPDSAALSQTGALTVEAWIRPTALNKKQVIVAKRGGASPGGYELRLNATNQLVFVTFNSAGTSRSVTSAATVTQANVWVHVQGSVSGQGVMRVGLTGQVEAGVTGTLTLSDGTKPVDVGRQTASGTGQDHFGGRIDEVRISNTVRYTTGTWAIPNSYTTDANTMALWKMNEGSGPTVADASTGDTLSVSGVITPWPGGRTAASKTARRRETRLEDPLGVMGSEASRGEAFGGAGNGAETSTDKLLAATTQSWIEAYTYDQYGNLTMPGGPSVSGTNNRISAAGYGYDAAGNLTGDAATGNVLRYDAENRLWKVETAGGTPIAQYWYDGEGRRVRKQVFGTNGYTMRFVYDIGGNLVAEYTTSTAPGSPSKEYIYGPSGLLATIEGTTTSYVMADHLGSPRVVTASGGAVTGRHDLKPFGEEIGLIGGRSTAAGYAGSDTLRQRFDSKERDFEVGLDFFEARHYAAATGRFVSIDPLVSSGNTGLPQTWNRYAFVLNNPTVLSDPTGLFVFDKSVTADQRKAFSEALAEGYRLLATLDGGEEAYLLRRSLDAYGDEGVDNGVTITTENLERGGATRVYGAGVTPTLDNPTGQRVTIAFDPSVYKEENKQGFVGLVAHEGSHAADGSIARQTGFLRLTTPTKYDTEVKAYTVSAIIAQAQSPGRLHTTFTGYMEVKVKGRRRLAAPLFLDFYSGLWNPVDIPTLRRANIDRFLATPKSLKGYGLTPKDKTQAFPCCK
jgi:RHS repeat-associated protein